MKKNVKTFMLFTTCRHGETKEYICTLKGTNESIIENTFNILKLKYITRENIEYLHDTDNNIIWWRKKLTKYPDFVLVSQQ